MASERKTSEERTRERLIDLAAEFYDQFDAGEIPHMTLPTRTKSNIEYDEDANVWVYGDRTSKRSANSVRGARKLLKAAYTIEFLARQLDEDRSSTLRELYYISESWDNEEAHFSDQDESNKLIEDLEIVSEVKREDFHMRPEESGAKLMGPLKIREQTNRGDREIHCQLDVGQGGYQIPNNPDTIEFLEHDVEFVMCVETGGMRDRLVENGFDDDYNALVVHLGGSAGARHPAHHQAPARRTRPAGRGVHRRRPVVLPHLRLRRLRLYQVRAPLGVSRHARGEVRRHPAAGHRGLRPPDRPARRFRH